MEAALGGPSSLSKPHPNRSQSLTHSHPRGPRSSPRHCPELLVLSTAMGAQASMQARGKQAPRPLRCSPGPISPANRSCKACWDSGSSQSPHCTIPSLPTPVTANPACDPRCPPISRWPQEGGSSRAKFITPGSCP